MAESEYTELNLKEKKYLSGNQVYLENDKIIPIGRAYKNDFTERFIN